MHSTVDESSVTQLLNCWVRGEDEALDRLIPLVYEDLRHVASKHMRAEQEAHLLQTTALVHEAFLRLGGLRGMAWTSRGHFFNWVSVLMRRILVEQARGRHAAKRGGGMTPDSLEALQEDAQQDEVFACPASDQWQSLLQLDQALDRLARLDPRQARVVELRFFGGMSVEQTAEALSISPATVKREWATARAWLLLELGTA